MSMFKKAVKSESKLRLAIAGPSGSGKTYTALALATALGGPVAVVDTEHGSAAKYADLFEFDTLNMEPPFHPRRFVEAIQDAAKAGYKVVVLDSLTHAWNGTGGMLDIVEEIAKRMKSPNSFAAWKDATPVQNALIDAILHAPIHVIATMRSKQEYILQDNGRGQQVPRKVGMAPQQRDGFEYEFDVFLDMDTGNNAIVSKTRCPELSERVFAKPGRDVAAILLKWLQGAPALAPQPPASGNGAHADLTADVDLWQPDAAVAADNGEAARRRRKLHALGAEVYGVTWDAKRKELVSVISKGRTQSSSDLTPDEYDKLIAGMEAKRAAMQPVGIAAK